MEPQQAVEMGRSLLKKRTAAREDNFLQLAERGIFQYAPSPYLPLLVTKKITFADLQSWVSKEGLENALHRLQEEGVYFTVDEFKGKVAVRRKDLDPFLCNNRMFDNPFLSFAYEVRSGATRSAGSRIRIDFDYLHQRSLYDAFLLDVHGCLTAPIVNWFPIFPGAPGINSSLRFAHIGNPAKKWFSQVMEDQVKLNWERKWGTKTLFAAHRLFGSPLATPEYAGLNDAHRVAEWVSRSLDEHQHCVVYTFAASAVRVCMAAVEANVSLKGAKFFVTGEPLTPHKKREIESTGAEAVPIYGISEAGVIAAGCNQSNEHSDHCHLYKDTTAVVTYRLTIPKFDSSVDAYLFTTLLYESPKLLLNVDLGDFGGVYSERCNCPFGELGFDTSLSDIRSYEKLTGEGVTFVYSDLVRIIEKELPEIFGGRSTDYQLVESQDANGFTRVQLLVSPRVGRVDESAVLDRFMTLLRNGEDIFWAQSGVEMWKQAKMVRIRRDDPISTVSGKVLPFHVQKSDKELPAVLAR